MNQKKLPHKTFQPKGLLMVRAITIGALFSLLIFSPSRANDISIGTPNSPTAAKIMFLGAGELGKEVIIELQRLGIEVIAVDRYNDAPGMQVAHRRYVTNMLDGKLLRGIIEKEKPHLIVPEIEAIATDELLTLEKEGYRVIPTARAAYITMNRERIRSLAAEELGLKTSKYIFAQTLDEYRDAVHTIGLPCVVKPIMSSSGKGQSIVRQAQDIDKAWVYAQTGGRAALGKVIVEEFIPFDFEITLLTVRDQYGNTHFCEPIGHLQIDGDYRESWQPQPMSATAQAEAQRIAKTITDALGGVGIFGVELFVKGNQVYFSEVSPRPHDTGMVTLISQDLSEFALHARAILGLPIPGIRYYGPAASCALLVQGDSDKVRYGNLYAALAQPDTQLRLFGKPQVRGHRRMGVGLALGSSIEQAREKAREMVKTITIDL
jgi:phosphoribosylglycinamide formyltransferase 2